MTAVPITPATAGAELVDELRKLAERYEGVESLEGIRELADEMTAGLRRLRGRLGRLTRQAKPKAEPRPTEAQRAPAAASRAEAAPAVAPRVPAPTGQSAAENRPEPPAARTAPPAARPPAAEPPPVRPAPPTAGQLPARRQPTPVRARPATGPIAGVLATAWSLLVVRPARGIRRLARTIRTTIRRGAPAMPLPRPGDAPPLSATRRSPLDIAAGLQSRKAHSYAAYQDTVLQWELGTRAYQCLDDVEQPAPAAGDRQ